LQKKADLLNLSIEVFNEEMKLQFDKDGLSYKIHELNTCNNCGRLFQNFCICPESNEKSCREIRKISNKDKKQIDVENINLFEKNLSDQFENNMTLQKAEKL
jgi:hypothetical protein